MEEIELQALKAYLLMLQRFFGKRMVVRPVEQKAYSPISLTPSGMDIVESERQLKKSSSGFFDIFVGSTAFSIFLQITKALFPMLVTLLGMVTEVRPQQL